MRRDNTGGRREVLHYFDQLPLEQVVNDELEMFPHLLVILHSLLAREMYFVEADYFEVVYEEDHFGHDRPPHRLRGELALLLF